MILLLVNHKPQAGILKKQLILKPIIKMDKKEEEQVFGFINVLIMPIAILSSLWGTYIIWDICVLYNLQYLTQFGYEVFFGTIFLIGLIHTRLNSGKSFNRTNKDALIIFLGSQVGIFMTWAIAYLLHWLLRF